MGKPIGEAYRQASSLLGLLCELPSDTDSEVMGLLIQLIQTVLSNFTCRMMRVEVQAWTENNCDHFITLSLAQSSIQYPALAAIPTLPSTLLSAAIEQVQQELELKAGSARQNNQASGQSLMTPEAHSTRQQALRRHRTRPARFQEMVEVPSKPVTRLVCIYCHVANEAPRTAQIEGRVALCNHLEECHAQGTTTCPELACPQCEHRFRSTTATFPTLVTRLMKHTQKVHGFVWEARSQRHEAATEGSYCCVFCKAQGGPQSRQEFVTETEMLKHVSQQHVVQTGRRIALKCPYCPKSSVSSKARTSAKEILSHVEQAHDSSNPTACAEDPAACTEEPSACSEEPASQLDILSEVAAQEMSLMKQTQGVGSADTTSQPDNHTHSILNNHKSSQMHGQMLEQAEILTPGQSELGTFDQHDHLTSDLQDPRPSSLSQTDQLSHAALQSVHENLRQLVHHQTISRPQHQTPDEADPPSSDHLRSYMHQQPDNKGVLLPEGQVATLLDVKSSLQSMDWVSSQSASLKPEGVLPSENTLVPSNAMAVVPLIVVPVQELKDPTQDVQVLSTGHSGGQVTIHVTSQPPALLAYSTRSVLAPAESVSVSQVTSTPSQITLDVLSSPATLSGGNVTVKDSVNTTAGPSPSSHEEEIQEEVKLEAGDSDSDEIDSDLDEVEDDEDDADYSENHNSLNSYHSKASNKRKTKRSKGDSSVKRMKKEPHVPGATIYCVFCTDPKSIKDKCVSPDGPTFSSITALKDHLCSHIQGSGMDQYLVCPVCGLERHTIFSHTRALLAAFLNHVYRTHAVCYSSTLRQHSVPQDLDDEDDMHCPSTALRWPCAQADDCGDFPNRMQLVAHIIEHHLTRCKNESSLQCMRCRWLAVGQDGTGRGHIYISNKYVDHCILSHGLLAAQCPQHGTTQRPLGLHPQNGAHLEYPSTVALLDAAVRQARQETAQQTAHIRKYAHISFGQGTYYCFLCPPPVQHFDQRADLIDHFFEAHIELCETSALLLRCTQCLKQCSRLPSDRSMMKSAWGLIDFLLNHMVKVHGLAVPDYASILTCTLCGLETILSEWVMCYHMKRTHGISVAVGNDSTQDTTRSRDSAVLLGSGPMLPCPQCGDTFRTRKALYIHVRFTHHKLKNILCHMCGKAFYQDYELVAHAWSLHKVNLGKQDLVECDVCGEKMVRKLLSNHRKKHSTDLYTCDICGRTMKHHGNFMAHLRKHEVRRTTLACQKCGFVCASHKSLTNHMARVHDVQRFQCQLCKYVGLGASALKAHLDRVHADGSTVNYCVICKKQFCNKGSFENHMFVIHDLNLAQRPVLECAECGIHTLGAALMRKHMANHLPVTDAYQCNICQKAFKNARQKREHEKRSHGAKTRQCPHCSYTATTESHFARHNFRHHQDVQPVYACSQCMYMSLHADRYHNHMRRVHGVGRDEEQATLSHLAIMAQVDPSRVGRASVGTAELTAQTELPPGLDREESPEGMPEAAASAAVLLEGLEPERTVGQASYTLPSSNSQPTVAESLQLLLAQSEGHPLPSTSSLLSSVVSVVATTDGAPMPPSSATSSSLAGTSFVASPYVMSPTGGSLLPITDTVVSLQGLEQLLMPSQPTSLPEFATIVSSQAPALSLLAPSSTQTDLTASLEAGASNPDTGLTLPAQSNAGFIVAGSTTPSASILQSVCSPLYSVDGNSQMELLPQQYEARLMAAISQLGEEVAPHIPAVDRLVSQAIPVTVTTHHYSNIPLMSAPSNHSPALSMPSAAPPMSTTQFHLTLPPASASSLQAALPPLEASALPVGLTSLSGQSLPLTLSSAVGQPSHTSSSASTAQGTPVPATLSSTFSLQDLRFCSQAGNATQLYLPPD